MPDDPTKRGEADRIRINIEEDHEVRYWTQELNVTRDRLIEAVKDVGPMVEDVRKELGQG